MPWADNPGWFSRRSGQEEAAVVGRPVAADRPGSAGASSVCFCTLAIHAPYRQRARLLCADLAPAPIVVLTDEPADFADLPVSAIRHAPTGPMAIDFLERLGPTGNNQGGAAYHDKRFALRAALERHDSAIFVDADSRLTRRAPIGALPPGLAVMPLVRRSIAEHLEIAGGWRLPIFEDLAKSLTGDTAVLHAARWCHETPLAVTKDGREDAFFAAWDRGAEHFQARSVFSGEGGVIGLAAARAGWSVDFDAVAALADALAHEGGGPKAR